MKMRIKVFKFLLSLEEHSVYYSVYYSNKKNSFCAPVFASTIRVPNGHSMYKMCAGRIVKYKFSKLTADTSFQIVQEYIADKTDH